MFLYTLYVSYSFNISLCFILYSYIVIFITAFIIIILQRNSLISRTCEWILWHSCSTLTIIFSLLHMLYIRFYYGKRRKKKRSHFARKHDEFRFLSVNSNVSHDNEGIRKIFLWERSKRFIISNFRKRLISGLSCITRTSEISSHDVRIKWIFTFNKVDCKLETDYIIHIIN